MIACVDIVVERKGQKERSSESFSSRIFKRAASAKCISRRVLRASSKVVSNGINMAQFNDNS